MNLAHPWEVSPAEARAIQERLRGQVITHDALGPLNLVAGVDVGFEDGGATARAAVVTLRFPALTVYERALARQPVRFPYVPGLLSFREVPVILAALAELGTAPDLLLVDGHGRIHPRRCGIACHLGLLTDTPTIGIGKTPFVGQHAPLPDERGAWQPIAEAGETLGAALRTRAGVKPIYVSVGHRISLVRSIDITMGCTPRYRLPETTRQAHRLASHGASKP